MGPVLVERVSQFDVPGGDEVRYEAAPVRDRLRSIMSSSECDFILAPTLTQHLRILAELAPAEGAFDAWRWIEEYHPAALTLKRDTWDNNVSSLAGTKLLPIW